MKLDRVCFSYPERPVLNHFSLELPDQGVLALAGPSGCGKTTILRLLAGFIKPQSGQITPFPGEHAFLFQENRLFSGFTAAQQILAVKHNHCEPSYWLSMVELSGEEDSRVELLSGGMQRRVALARALAYAEKKGLLILDEPFSGVDPDCAIRIMQRIRELYPCILFSSHEPWLLNLADQIYTINDSRS